MPGTLVLELLRRNGGLDVQGFVELAGRIQGETVWTHDPAPPVALRLPDQGSFGTTSIVTVLAQWVNGDATEQRLLSSRWDGAGWSPAEPVAAGESLSNVTVGLDDGALVSAYVRDLDPEPYAAD